MRVAVFAEDVITQYQQFLARRRADRPASEYREPTPQEWQEIQEHFDKRRVELGSCGRPYGTPCTHEHACIRCPMLSINRQGEIEGIDLTLTFLRGKREQTRRFERTGPTDLGLPLMPQQKSWPRK
ncbi:hypothetical protein [Streptomyces sp. ME19-01-6]|uniref:hypothetical protein n=1 Tax=Streptomyces sp. ME19-01-6 TaxID=3028686 RepID=UPI0029CA356B|nr:hypothetical protein [Streptomyces sp. ME19-01-6]